MSEKVEALKKFVVTVCREKMNHEILDADINLQLPVQEAFQLDSISMFELVVNFEEKYEREIPDDHIEQIGKMRLDELVHYLEGQAV
jgi:acyl carrier protein